MSITQEDVPESVDEELREFLTRRFLEIGVALDQTPTFPMRKEMPYKPQEGVIHYFGSPLTHDYDPEIAIEGWWGYIDGKWVPISSQFSVFAQYGGLRLLTPEPFVLDATWRAIPFDSIIVTNPRSVVQDPATDSLYVSTNGIWRMSVVVTFTQDLQVNTARAYQLRVHNLTRGLSSPTLFFATGRNEDVSQANAASIEELLVVTTLEQFQVQIRTDDIYIGVEMIEANFSVNAVSEYIP